MKKVKQYLFVFLFGVMLTITGQIVKAASFESQPITSIAFKAVFFGFQLFVVREDDRSEGYQESLQMSDIRFGIWGGLEKPYKGEVKLDDISARESFMDHTTWFWHWDDDYVRWKNDGENKKHPGCKRIQFSVMNYCWKTRSEIENAIEVRLLKQAGFRLIKCWAGNGSNDNYLMELPDGYMFYMEWI